MIGNLQMEINLHCFSEYDSLHQVILSPPTFMNIREVINHTQQYYAEENINNKIAINQHQHLVRVLNENNIQTVILPAVEQFPEQVYTRDIGFTIGKTLFIGNMKQKIRQGEERVFINWLNKNNVPYSTIKNGSIEGGDVLVDKTNVWIGDSGRTSESAIKELSNYLQAQNEYCVNKIRFNNKYLHLDCVFNIISENEAICFPPAIHQDDFLQLSSHYNVLEVSEEEQFTLGTNVLPIGNKKIISHPANKNINKKLINKQYNVIEVDISEIIKSGGAFRCITMPLSRY